MLSQVCFACDELPVLGQLHRLTRWEDGVIIVATLLLFPTARALFGGVAVFFAAREAVHGYFLERGRKEGLKEGQKVGQQAERERIKRELAQRGIDLTPELAKILEMEPTSNGL